MVSLTQWIKCLFPRLLILFVAFSRQTNAALFSTQILNVSHISWPLIQVTACLTDSLFCSHYVCCHIYNCMKVSELTRDTQCI